jgi:hypothetical protein
MDLVPGDVDRATAWVVGVSAHVAEERWSVLVGDGWSPRRTLDHIVDALLLYCGYVATRASGRMRPLRDGDPEATPEELVEALRSASSILTVLLDAMPDGDRAFHRSGRADRTGWIGMACTELLVHGYDIAVATGTVVPPPDDRMAHAVVDRVLPWAPPDASGWARLLWATGRAPLGSIPPQDADWWWQSAPLAEWNGETRRRDVPPQW